MKKISLGIASIFVLSLLFAFTFQTSWKIGPKYNISFSTSGVSGVFKSFTWYRNI